MAKLVIFRADKGEKERYQQLTATGLSDSFFRVANAGSVPSLTKTIAEHRDASGKPSPTPGDRLTETIPNSGDNFRDSGWEVTRVEEYTPNASTPNSPEFESVCICYCAYLPLSADEAWTKQARRIGSTVASVGATAAPLEQAQQAQTAVEV